MKQSLLIVKDLHKSVKTNNGSIDILKGVNMEIGQHESIAIVGQSGSGKSTLLGLLAGLDLPQKGTIQMDGQEITRLNEDQRALFRAEKTGFVFQSFYLMDDLTALENIALPLELFGHKKPKTTAQQWLKQLGLSARAGHFPNQLSGGEQQRVALGRAFALNPQILFADEPTANLDEETAKQVIKQLFTLHHSNNNSMILVTHDTKLAQRCDRIYYLNQGKLHDNTNQHTS